MMTRIFQGIGIGGLTLFGLRGLLPEVGGSGLLLLIVAVGAIAALLIYLTGAREPVPMGALARQMGLLTEEEIENILNLQEKRSEKFGEIALAEQFLTKRQLSRILELKTAG